jgi:hypothetical protein
MGVLAMSKLQLQWSSEVQQMLEAEDKAGLQWQAKAFTEGWKVHLISNH